MNNWIFSAQSAAVRLLAALSLVAALWGCRNLEIEPVVTDSSQLVVSAGDAPDFSGSPVLTKGQVFTEDGSFVFDDNERIAIWYTDGTYRDFPVVAGTVDTGSQTAGRTGWALYPLSAVPASSPYYDGNNPKVVYAGTYTVSGKETDSQMPMVAENSAGNNKLVFYHVGGLLRLKLYGVPDNVKSVKVAFETTAITGTFTVDVTNASAPVTTGTGTGKAVIFNLDRPKDEQGNVIYDPVPYVNVPLPAGEYPKQKLYVTLYDGEDGQGNVVKKDGAPDAFETEVDFTSIARRDGRILGVSLYGITGAVVRVEISGETGFLNPGDGAQIGGLYLNDTPFESQLYATVVFTNKSVQDNSLVEWESEKPEQVLVVNGKVMAVDVTNGPVKITARAKDDTSKEACVYITVSKQSPTGNFVQKSFTVSAADGDSVHFSPGNLVAKIANAGTAEGATWRFATHQYDIVGPTNGSTMSLAPGDSLDLFHYSSAGTHYGIFDGPSTSTSTIALNSFVDWGNNQIAYRDNAAYAAPYLYRTLTYDELKYILTQRTGAQAGRIGDRTDCRFAAVNIEGVYGLILFPDGFQWVRSTMGDYPKRINGYSAPDNSSYYGTWKSRTRETP